MNYTISESSVVYDNDFYFRVTVTEKARYIDFVLCERFNAGICNEELKTMVEADPSRDGRMLARRFNVYKNNTLCSDVTILACLALNRNLC